MPQVLDTKAVCDRGQAIYDSRLKGRLEPSHDGEYVAIDIDSGDFYLGETGSESLARARQGRPDGLFFLARVGHRAADFRRGAR